MIKNVCCPFTMIFQTLLSIRLPTKCSISKVPKGSFQKVSAKNPYRYISIGLSYVQTVLRYGPL